MEDVLHFFAKAPTTAIADASTALGLNLIMEGIGPLEPFTGARVAAPAATLRFAPVQAPGGGRASLYGVLEEIPRGALAVFAGGGTSLALVGANGARVLHRRGAAGAVADGAARDVLEIRELGLPVWCRGVRSLPYTRRLELIERDRPVECGGVQVAPGDILVADADGVAVVPRGRAEEVRQRVETVMAAEREFNERFARGEPAQALAELMQRKWR